MPDSRAKIGRNDPCPCGSGAKYKKCCGDRSDDAANTLLKSAQERLQSRLAGGPEPQPEDRQRMIQAMRDHNMDPAYVYAFEKTGLLVFQETLHLIPAEQMETWTAAYEEYASLQPGS